MNPVRSFITVLADWIANLLHLIIKFYNYDNF